MASVLGVAISLVKEFYSFCALRFFQSALAQGSALVAFTLVVEKLEPRQRNIGGIAYNFFWALAMLLLALMAYLLPDWRHLYLAMSLPTLLTVSYVWLVSESIPWLYAKQVRDIQTHAERTKPKKKRNKKKKKNPGAEGSSPVIGRGGGGGDDEDKVLSMESPNKTTTTHLAHLCNAKMLKRLVIVAYLWFVINLGYYGLSLSTPILAGNIYFNFFLSGLVEILSTGLVLAAISFVARRILLFCFAVFGGVALGAIAFLPDDAPDWGHVALFMAGRCGYAGAYAITFLYSQEVRNVVGDGRWEGDVRRDSATSRDQEYCLKDLLE